jgi:hypothetical protein
MFVARARAGIILGRFAAAETEIVPRVFSSIRR